MAVIMHMENRNSSVKTRPLHTAYRSRYSNWLLAGQSGDRFLVGERYSAPVQTGPGAHSASYKMGTGSFAGVKRPGA